MVANAAFLAAALVQAAAGSVLLKPLNSTAPAPRVRAALVQNQQRATLNGSRLDGLRAKRIAGLKDVASDLLKDEAQDNSNMKRIEKQLVGLVRQRNQMKRDKARKAREVSFIGAEISLIRRKSETKTTVEQVTSEDAQMNATDGSQAGETVVAGDAMATADAAAAAQGAEAGAATEAEASNGVEELASADAELSAQSGAEGQAQAGEGDSVSSAALSEADMEAQAETRMRAEAEAKARAKMAIEEAARQKAEAEQRAAEEARQKAEAAQVAKEKAEAEEKERTKNELADHADDSFKQFMKEEDGEDQMGDTDYEDSANALAGAIGWNRKDIESNANQAVKSLTEAIGGKKVIQSLQGMMAGVAR
jgi:hypothetical protein